MWLALICIASVLSQVSQLTTYFEPLIVASVGLASKHMDHQQQMNILDQTKTLAESALQMLYAAKEGGGNPKVERSISHHLCIHIVREQWLLRAEACWSWIYKSV